MSGRLRLSVTRAALAAGLGGLLILIALLFDAVPLFVPGVAGVLIGAVTPLWVGAGLAGARVERRLPAERGVEDQPVEYMLEVRRGLLAPPAAEVSDPFAGLRHELGGALSPLLGGRAARVRVRTRLGRRGLHRLPPPRLRSRDPLNLAAGYAIDGREGQELLVLPRTERVRWLAGGGLHRLELPEPGAGSEALASVDFDGLRPYRPGTPASRIHWPALARGAGLIERRLRADGEARPLVVLDARQAPAAAREALDQAVRAAASLVLELARGGGCGLLLPGDQRPTTVDSELHRWPALHDRLALVENTGARPPALASGTARGGPLIYVAAELPERPAALSAAAGGGPCLLVMPRAALGGRLPPALGRAPVALEVSGCQGFVLGRSRASRPTVAAQAVQR